MPELGPKDLSFIRKLKDVLRSTGLPRINPSRLLKEYSERYVGSGAEVVVVRNKDNPESDRLTAFNYKDVNPEDAKRIFYTQRVFSTLFPHNFPHFYASFGKDHKSTNDSVSGTIRQEIKKDSLSCIYPFGEVEKFCTELGLDFHPFFDTSLTNYIIGADGGEYYVDTINHQNNMAWDADKIVQYMKIKNYSREDIEIVSHSIERLKSFNQSKES